MHTSNSLFLSVENALPISRVQEICGVFEANGYYEGMHQSCICEFTKNLGVLELCIRCVELPGLLEDSGAVVETVENYARCDSMLSP